MNETIPAKQNHTLLTWFKAISIKSIDPQNSKIGNTEKIIGMSYDIN
jgi:hypothetical protein